MMAKGPIFSRINISKTTQQALAWFKQAIQKLSGTTITKEIGDEQEIDQQRRVEMLINAGMFKPVEHTDIGKMFLFRYDPKWKDRLPYWDEYPLVFPIGQRKGGFLGINLHYLPTGFRDPVLASLATLAGDDKYDDETKLDISYDILKNQAIFFSRFYKDCVRSYLYTQVRSEFQYVSPKDWSNVAAMPFERWTYKK